MSDHGTRSRYVYGCRCADCTAAEKVYQRERRAKAQAALPAPAPKVDPFASARAHDDGMRWPIEPLAERVGLHRAYVSASTTPRAIRAAGGLTDRQADRAAVRCGYHPGKVWVEWFTYADAISLAFAAVAAEMRAAR